MTGPRRALLVALALVTLAPAGAAAQGRPVARVAVAASGAVTFDGRPVSLPELRSELESLARWKGEVWYYRENPAAEPPPEALAVIEAIMQARLPVRFATKPDFSAFDGDVVEPGDVAPPPGP
jgi:hypothetical protein